MSYSIRFFLYGIFVILITTFLMLVVVPIAALLRLGGVKDLDLNYLFSKPMGFGSRFFLGVYSEIWGRKELFPYPSACIYVLNHQSNFDVMTEAAIYPPRTVLIGKKELIYTPFFGWYFVLAGNLLLDRANRVRAVAGLNRAVAAIQKEQKSVWVFPEGTRNKTAERLGPFKKGPFYMAVQAGVPIVPLVAAPVKMTFDPKNHRVGAKPYPFLVLDPILPGDEAFKSADTLLELTRVRMLEGIATLDRLLKKA